MKGLKCDQKVMWRESHGGIATKHLLRIYILCSVTKTLKEGFRGSIVRTKVEETDLASRLKFTVDGISDRAKKSLFGFLTCPQTKTVLFF